MIQKKSQSGREERKAWDITAIKDRATKDTKGKGGYDKTPHPPSQPRAANAAFSKVDCCAADVQMLVIIGVRSREERRDAGALSRSFQSLLRTIACPTVGESSLDFEIVAIG